MREGERERERKKEKKSKREKERKKERKKEKKRKREKERKKRKREKERKKEKKRKREKERIFVCLFSKQTDRTYVELMEEHLGKVDKFERSVRTRIHHQETPTHYYTIHELYKRRNLNQKAKR
jgi:hypothetical protein